MCGYQPIRLRKSPLVTEGCLRLAFGVGSPNTELDADPNSLPSIPDVNLGTEKRITGSLKSRNGMFSCTRGRPCRHVDTSPSGSEGKEVSEAPGCHLCFSFCP
jgi:hypothetical protein